MSIFKSLSFILLQNQKKLFFFIFFLIICATILELFGVGLILPITGLILDPESLKNFLKIGYLFENNFVLKSDTFFFYAIGFVLSVYI